MPAFWGPRAPDQVLAEGNYLRAAAVSGTGSSDRQVFKHLMNRVEIGCGISGASTTSTGYLR